MGKIFEALEQAQREQEKLKKPPIAVVPLHEESPPQDRGLNAEQEEEMLLLHQNLEALLPNTSKAILFIGAQEGEGTSTLVRDFALVSAVRLKKSVLLLDADYRNPTQHRFFRIHPKHTWDEILRNKRTFKKALYRIGDTSLQVFPIPQNSGSLPRTLYSAEKEGFWGELKQKYDLILIDSAPVAIAHDGVDLSRIVDGVVLVLEAEKTRGPAAKSMKDRIVNNGGKILGIVFNKRRYYIPEWMYKRL